MKKYVIIKLFANIGISNIYEFVNTKQDAFTMRDILQRSETNKEVKYFVYELTA